MKRESISVIIHSAIVLWAQPQAEGVLAEAADSPVAVVSLPSTAKPKGQTSTFAASGQAVGASVGLGVGTAEGCGVGTGSVGCGVGAGPLSHSQPEGQSVRHCEYHSLCLWQGTPPAQQLPAPILPPAHWAHIPRVQLSCVVSTVGAGVMPARVGAGVGCGTGATSCPTYTSKHVMYGAVPSLNTHFHWKV